MKRCNQCEDEKPLSDFYIDRKAGSKREGGYVRKTTVYRQPCKECLTKNKRERYANDAQFNQRQKDIANKWAHSKKGIERRRIAGRKRTKTTKFKQYRKWYSKHTEKGIAYRKKQRKRWLKSPNGKLYNRRKAGRRRARRYSVLANLTNAEWGQILELYQGQCAYCGETKPLTQDHIIPFAKGGEHIKDNVVPACKSCNSKKGTQLWQPLSSKQVKSLAI